MSLPAVTAPCRVAGRVAPPADAVDLEADAQPYLQVLIRRRPVHRRVDGEIAPAPGVEVPAREGGERFFDPLFPLHGFEEVAARRGAAAGLAGVDRDPRHAGRAAGDLSRI